MKQVPSRGQIVPIGDNAQPHHITLPRSEVDNRAYTGSGNHRVSLSKLFDDGTYVLHINLMWVLFPTCNTHASFSRTKHN